MANKFGRPLIFAEFLRLSYFASFATFCSKIRSEQKVTKATKVWIKVP